MRIAVCTVNTPEIDDFAKYTEMNFRSYCNKHGYGFVMSNTNLDTSRPPHWSKIKLLQQFIDKYDWLVWIDSDATITNKDIKIESIIDSDYDIIISKEECCAYVINTGVFIIKCSEWSKNFLNEWYSQEQFINAIWLDNSAFIHIYNNNPDVKLHTKVVRQKILNSRPGTFLDGDFIYHCTYPAKDRNQLKTLSYYKDTKYVSSREQIPELLDKLGLFGYGIEIGVERGLYSESILSNSHILKLYLCDPWKHLDDYNDINNTDDNIQEQKLAETIARLNRFKDRLEILRMLSQDATKLFYDESLDFVYIDGNHKYEYVLEDIESWYPKVRNGGIIAGHDFLNGDIPNAGKFGVRQAVTEFFKYAPCVYITAENYPSWYVIK